MENYSLKKFSLSEFNNLIAKDNNKYELFGIKEYWIANPDTEIITIYNFENKTNNEYIKSDKLVSAVFNELEINIFN